MSLGARTKQSGGLPLGYVAPYGCVVCADRVGGHDDGRHETGTSSLLPRDDGGLCGLAVSLSGYTSVEEMHHWQLDEVNGNVVTIALDVGRQL